MKATKKIVGAACALVAAVALSAGSTFAWFVSNGEVTATGLEVAVKTNNSYLCISDTVAGLADGEKELDLSILGKKNDKAIELLPSAYKNATDGTDTDIIYQDKVGTENAITEYGTWYTGDGTTAKDGTLNSTTKVALTSENFANYVIVANMYVGVLGATGVTSVSAEMSVELTEATKDADAITILFMYRYVAIDEEGVVEPGTAADWNHNEVTCASDSQLKIANLLASGEELTEESCIQIKVMVYFDGNHSSVTTDNQTNLTGATLDFTFSSEKETAEESGS